MTKLGGRYELGELLGEGGMAQVYKAYHPRLDRTVAVKLMHRHLAKDREFNVRFEREAKAIAQLKHPHIVQVYDFDYDTDQNQYYMVIEYLDGPTLGDVISDEKLDINRVLTIMTELTDALAYAHAEGMQHRDIKPSNVMLDKGQRTVLTDFGIAKIMREGGQQITASGAMVGTPAYMSPEQASGLPGDYRADIYSLGIVFYQLATGRLPYEGDTPLATILKHIKEAPQPPSKWNPNIPPGAEAIILRCMAKSPDDRYQSAREMLNHLRNLSEAASELDTSRILSSKVFDETAFGLVTNRSITDTWTNAPRSTTITIGVGAFAIIALLVIGVILFTGVGSSPSTEAEPSPCVVELTEDIPGRTEPDLETTARIIFNAGETVQIVDQLDGFWFVEGTQNEAWITQDALVLPDGCDVN